MTDSKMQVSGRRGDLISLPCAAHAYPLPDYRWFIQENGQLRPITPTHRISQLEGTLIIQQATVVDSGHYVCVVNNSLGDEKIHTRLLITGKIFLNK